MSVEHNIVTKNNDINIKGWMRSAKLMEETRLQYKVNMMAVWKSLNVIFMVVMISNINVMNEVI